MVAVTESGGRTDTVDLFDPATLADPYPTYAWLRQHDPFRRDRLGIWMLSRHRDVAAVLRGSEFTSDPFAWDLYPEIAEVIYHDLDCPLLVLQRTWLMLREGPPHQRARRSLASALTPRQVDSVQRLVHECVESTCEQLRADGGGDLVVSLARVLPVRVIAHLLGMPLADAVHCQELMDRVLLTFGIGGVPAATLAAANDAAAEIQRYFADLVATRSARPGDDVLSEMLHEHGELLTRSEWIANTALLFAAGHETTVNLLGNGLYALLRHPDQLNALAGTPGLASGAVDEALRYDSPMQLVSRSARVDVRMGDHVVAAGDHVVLLIGAANRDPERFAEPDEFLVTRSTIDHLSFGAGAHFCLGSRLARSEAITVFTTVARTFHGLRLDIDEVTRGPYSSHRGLARLVVSCGGAAATIDGPRS
jgi:cytochrome P450